MSNRSDDCLALFGQNVVNKEFIIPREISFQEAKMTCRVALMRLIEYFNHELPEDVDVSKLRKLVMYLGGDVNNQNSAAWQEMQQQKTLVDRTDCLLMRKGGPGTSENSMFYFDIAKYKELSQQPSYILALKHLRESVSDDIIRVRINAGCNDDALPPPSARISKRAAAECSAIEAHAAVESEHSKNNFKLMKKEDCAHIFSQISDYKMVVTPDISSLDADVVLRVALMRLIEYFDKELPVDIDSEKLLKLVLYLGGHVDSSQNLEAAFLPLVRKYNDNVLSFDAEKYDELSQQPLYALPLHHLRQQVSDVLIRRYVVNILTGCYEEDYEI